ncbi:MAG: hypothetical protein AAFP76_16605 [Bacteroidota bacterium]
MSKSRKIFLGVLTFLPMLLLVGYFLAFFFMFFQAFSETQQALTHQDEMNPMLFAGGIRIMFLFIFGMIFLNLGLLAYYIIHANKNPKFDSNQKLIWILVLLLAQGVGTIVYYFVEIVPLDPKENSHYKDLKQK